MSIDYIISLFNSLLNYFRFSFGDLLIGIIGSIIGAFFIWLIGYIININIKKIRIKALYEKDLISCSALLSGNVFTCDFPNIYFPHYQILSKGDFDGPYFSYVAYLRITSTKNKDIRINEITAHFVHYPFDKVKKTIHNEFLNIFFSRFVKRIMSDKVQYIPIIRMISNADINKFVEPTRVDRVISIENDFYVPFFLRIKDIKQKYRIKLKIFTSLRTKPYSIRVTANKAPGWWWQGTE